MNIKINRQDLDMIERALSELIAIIGYYDCPEQITSISVGSFFYDEDPIKGAKDMAVDYDRLVITRDKLADRR